MELGWLCLLRSSQGLCVTCSRYKWAEASGICPAAGRLWSSQHLYTDSGPSGSPYDTTFVPIQTPKVGEGKPRWQGSGISEQGCEFLYFSVPQCPSAGGLSVPPLTGMMAFKHCCLCCRQNKADCCRWLGADKSRYCYQYTKKPFIKVLSDLKLWIYQSLLTNGIKPSPV